jgi:L-threonylcarbamoyladenylate synthase
LPTEIIRLDAAKPDAGLVTYVAEQIRAGQVAGIPTDTFYGLAADPFNLRAVDRIYEVKTRARHKPLSLLIDSVDRAMELARPLPDLFFDLTARLWPGPLTIIVKAAPRLPLKVTANTGNVALRLPGEAIPRALVTAADLPLTATSANLSGASECTTAQEVRKQFGSKLSIIVDGGTTPRNVPSTIVDLTGEDGGWKLLREGAIPEQDLVEILGPQ